MRSVYIPMALALAFLIATFGAALMAVTYDGRFGLLCFLFGVSSVGFGISACINAQYPKC
jgi:hypothetical protein